MNSEDLALLSLSEMYLSQDQLLHTNLLVNQVTFPIREVLDKVSQHKVEVVPTGSIFEKYGKPLNAQALETNLKSDYDVMFAYKKEEFPIEISMINNEFLHVFLLSDSCRLLNSIKKMDKSTKSFKLSAEAARQFMKQVVENSQIFYQESNYKQKIGNKLWNVLAFLFNLPRIGKYVLIGNFF